ncbi:hypothetical protein D3C77_819380 [compost metagenome]
MREATSFNPAINRKAARYSSRAAMTGPGTTSHKMISLEQNAVMTRKAATQ